MCANRSERAWSEHRRHVGFRGHAKPGSSFVFDAAWEYSLTRSWGLAIDVAYRHDGNSRVSGYNILDPTGVANPPSIRMDSGKSEAFLLAPAIEYSRQPNVGVIVGTCVIPAGRSTAVTVTPAVAINIVR